MEKRLLNHLWGLALLLSLLQLAAAPPVYAQGAEKTITGRVTDVTNNDPLPGVSVLVKGTTIGTTTDSEGNYRLSAPGNASTLVFSYVGYLASEVAVNNRSVIDITLNPDVKALSEVVVVGYGTQAKRDVISSISTVRNDKIEKINGASFEQALQGNVSGLRINTASGDPEADTRIQIRGTKSITAGTEPFILIDGVPISNGATQALSTINPSDIASVSVLKDAAATAIYGSRGANGVILITTKTGRNGKGQFSYSFNQGINKPINQIQLANAAEWRGLVAEGRKNAGFTDPTDDTFVPIRLPLLDQRNDNLTRYTNLNLYKTTDTDWQKLVIRDGSQMSHTFSVSKGDDKANYYISGNYFNQKPNWIGTDFKRYTGRVNVGFSPSNYLKIDVRNTFSHTDNQRQNVRSTTVNFADPNLNYGGWGGYWGLYSSALPVFPQRWPDNDAPFDPFSGNNLTYSADRNNAYDNLATNRNLSSVNVEATPLPGLTLRLAGGIDYTTTEDSKWISKRMRIANVKTEDLASSRPDTLNYIYNGSPRYDTRNVKRLNLNANFTANYERTILDNHKISALLGYEVTDQRNQSTALQAQNGDSRVEGTLGLIRTSDQFLEYSNNMGSNVRFLSYFTRLNYNFRERYQLQATLRRDGSSNFSPNYRFALFPSLAAGWVISEDPFFKDKLGAINYLKAKASWGLTGNSNIPPFGYIGASFENWPNYSNTSTAYIQSQIASGDIRWEKSATTDIGLNFGLFNRFTGSVGYFNSLTTDMLFNVPLAPSIGIYSTNNAFVGALANIGSMKNWGWEFELSSENVRSRDGGFGWTTDLNLTLNKNKVITLYPEFSGSPTTLSINGLTTVQLGKPIGMFYLPAFAGYDANGNPTIKEIDPEAASRQEYVFTGNTLVPTSSQVNANSIVQDGKTGIPTFFGGLTNTLSYKGISFSFLLYFQGGNYLYDNIGALRNIGSGQTVLRKDLATDSWSAQNTDAYYRAPTWTNRELGTANPSKAKNVSDDSDHFLQRGDFMRLKTLTLSYQLPASLLKKLPFSNINVFMNMNNVATFTKVRGFDPEQLYAGIQEDVINSRPTTAVQRNLGQGIVNFAPPIQVFSANWGINLNF
ncbi:TonB-dependent receptor [Telluribacter sp.]|jgi:TonB-linked SusC/RagA family outer membrane protein|uniref:SusC/RagA family TonB-linked outer membrane protein n=1 Tax=Telluribacter sp. TaxID=1978767 RepID=UPI002E0DC9B3|nr:TonB-dependent receptor [Telluribacter sp.]